MITSPIDLRKLFPASNGWGFVSSPSIMERSVIARLYESRYEHKAVDCNTGLTHTTIRLVFLTVYASSLVEDVEDQLLVRFSLTDGEEGDGTHYYVPGWVLTQWLLDHDFYRV